MTRAVRPANASAISRILSAAGFYRSEEHSASRGMVRGGWTTWTTGFVAEQERTDEPTQVQRGVYLDGSPRLVWVDSLPTGHVLVTYQFASRTRLDGHEQATKAHEVLTRAAEVLRGKGFEVEMIVSTGQHGWPSLRVCRRDVDGAVVTC